MPKPKIRSEEMDSHQTVVLCRDELRWVASLLGGLGPEDFSRHQQDCLKLLREVVDAACYSLEALLGSLVLSPAAALDKLLRHDRWQHPSQVLDRPRPEPKILLELCEIRLQQAEETERTRLVETRGKLERAARIDAEARRKRERIRRREERLGSGGKKPGARGTNKQ